MKSVFAKQYLEVLERNRWIVYLLKNCINYLVTFLVSAHESGTKIDWYKLSHIVYLSPDFVGNYNGFKGYFSHFEPNANRCAANMLQYAAICSMLLFG